MPRFYIMPMVIDDALDPAKGPMRHAKYIAGFDKASAIDYGTEDVCIVRIQTVSAAQHTALVSNPDCIGTPENIDQNLTQNAVDTISTFLESLNIPADWINTSKTYRQVVRNIAAIFQFNQCWNGVTGGSSPFKDGLNLSIQYNQLSAQNKAILQECFIRMGFNTDNLFLTSTLRTILKEFASQFLANKTIIMGEAV